MHENKQKEAGDIPFLKGVNFAQLFRHNVCEPNHKKPKSRIINSKENDKNDLVLKSFFIFVIFLQDFFVAQKYRFLKELRKNNFIIY